MWDCKFVPQQAFSLHCLLTQPTSFSKQHLQNVGIIGVHAQLGCDDASTIFSTTEQNNRQQHPLILETERPPSIRKQWHAIRARSFPR